MCVKHDSIRCTRKRNHIRNVPMCISYKVRAINWIFSSSYNTLCGFRCQIVEPTVMRIIFFPSLKYDKKNIFFFQNTMQQYMDDCAVGSERMEKKQQKNYKARTHTHTSQINIFITINGKIMRSICFDAEKMLCILSAEIQIRLFALGSHLHGIPSSEIHRNCLLLCNFIFAPAQQAIDWNGTANQTIEYNFSLYSFPLNECQNIRNVHHKSVVAW